MSLDRVAEYIDGIPITDGDVLHGLLMCLYFDELGTARDLSSRCCDFAQARITKPNRPPRRNPVACSGRDCASKSQLSRQPRLSVLELGH